MKKLLILLLLVPSLSWGDELDDLNLLLIDFENKINTCLEADEENKECALDIGNQYLIDVMGNAKLMKLIASSECEIGTECASNLARIAGKVIKLSTFLYD